MEGKTHFERVVGGTQKEREEAAVELQGYFEIGSKRLAEYQLEKTISDIEILNKTESIVDKIVEKYGGGQKNVPLDHIYILKPESVYTISGGKFKGGIHNPYSLSIGVEKGSSELLFASAVAHELFHLKSYKTARVGSEGEGAILYRSGLSMFDRKNSGGKIGEEKEYFGILEEAIVAECTKKFLEELEEADFIKEAKALDMIRDWIAGYNGSDDDSSTAINEALRDIKYIEGAQDIVDEVLAYSDDEKKRQAFATGVFASVYKNKKVEWVERRKEREQMYELLDNLVARSSGKFATRDEVFDEFAKANFSGNYLPLARIVEDILGKGSFRVLAEDFSLNPKEKNIETSEQ